MTPRFRIIPATLAALALLTGPASAQSGKDPDAKNLERDLLRQLIEINTSDSAGHTAEAAKLLADRLIAAGLPAADVQVLGYDPRYQSLVARYRGRSTGIRPSFSPVSPNHNHRCCVELAILEQETTPLLL